MLNLYRRHRGACPKAGTRSQDCTSKPKCPIHFEGIDGTGKRHNPQSLQDPASGSGVRDWNRAVEVIREMELPRPVAAPTCSVRPGWCWDVSRLSRNSRGRPRWRK